MKNALTYITRACPRNCEYCDIATSHPLDNELNPTEWKEAFSILHNIGVSFNLILGNEAWLLGDDLIDIMNQNQVPFAMYTTAPQLIFRAYREAYFEGPIDNLSCGIDYPASYLNKIPIINMNQMERKSHDGWKALYWTRTEYPYLDTQGNITIHRKNYKALPLIVHELAYIGVFSGVNFIHWNKDGKYDFFPSAEELEGFLFSPQDMVELLSIFQRTLKQPHTIQHPEILPTDGDSIIQLSTMSWHCGGNPYGGPTIDADGSLRCCGYRKGTVTPDFSIFDLSDPRQLPNWKSAVYHDAMACPGCSWSYPRMFAYWKYNDPDFGKKVFTKHAGKHIPEKKWSDRRTE